jgi:hypothetical protein
LGVRLQLESHHRAAWPTMDLFEGNFQGLLTFT